MCNNEIDIKQIILEAAEAEFLEKGFGNTKMMAIAKRAGVSHPLLHYHFQSKENLFQMIFKQKIKLISKLFEGISEQHLPFTETIRLFIETQFDFIAQNPRLPLFVVNEVIANKKNLVLVINVVKPKISEIFGRLETMLNEEIKKGAVRPVKFIDLISDILSMNIFTFLALPMLEAFNPNFDEAAKELILKERRESNVQFVLQALKS